jgi:hypothetical protein
MISTSLKNTIFWLEFVREETQGKQPKNGKI